MDNKAIIGLHDMSGVVTAIIGIEVVVRNIFGRLSGICLPIYDIRMKIGLDGADGAIRAPIEFDLLAQLLADFFVLVEVKLRPVDPSDVAALSELQPDRDARRIDVG